MVTKASSPHSTATGTPSQARATVSITATTSPNTVVTSRYLRLTAAKPRSAAASSPWAPRRRASFWGKLPASTTMNSTSVTMKNTSESSPSSPPRSPPANSASRPRSNPANIWASRSSPMPSCSRPPVTPSSIRSSSAW
ncbi:UNVERIFIED_CONTAM: hypothetical protein RF648_11105 [Kocuria sp. CPCC 205274]